jgi:murein DD-endopeptidase MepM/ murein hydrolase activator NlpD
MVCKQNPHKEKQEILATFNIKSYSPKTGEIFSDVLKRTEIPSNSVNQIIQVLQKINFKFTSLNPYDTFKVFFRNDTLVKLEYKKNYSTIYCFENLMSDNITVKMEYKAIENQVKLVKGIISSSLYESMLEIGEKPSLIANYADILAWEVDFFTETQTGDSFFVVVEKKFSDSICIDYGRLFAVRYKGKVGDFSGFYFIDPKGNRDYYDLQGKSMRKAFLKSPLRYSYISSYFSRGRYHPILKIVRPHQGIDYVAQSGTPVSAIGDGTVTYAGWRGGYGRLVEITHSQRFKSRYGHLSRFGSGIRSGRRVNQGQIVGYVGTTGLSTGPHLHFELLQNGSWVNPLKIIPPRAEPVKPEFLSEFAKHRDSLLIYLNSQNQTF